MISRHRRPWSQRTWMLLGYLLLVCMFAFALWRTGELAQADREAAEKADQRAYEQTVALCRLQNDTRTAIRNEAQQIADLAHDLVGPDAPADIHARIDAFEAYKLREVRPIACPPPVEVPREVPMKEDR